MSLSAPLPATEVIFEIGNVRVTHCSGYNEPVIIPESRLRGLSSEEAETDGDHRQCPCSYDSSVYGGDFRHLE